MTAKKSEKANLESKKNTFLQLGAIVAISFTLVAFEWSTNEFQSDELASSLAEELSPEIVNEFTIVKPQLNIPKPTESQSQSGAEVLVTEMPFEVEKKNEEKIFEDLDPSEFIEEKEVEPIEIEKVKMAPESFNADSPFFDGILPHYSKCEGLSGEEMFECISGQIKDKFLPETDNISSLRFTGDQIVTTTFTVDEKGKVSEVYIHGAKKLEKDLLKEVERALFNLPQMIPGSQGGEPIKARFTLPLNFTIR